MAVKRVVTNIDSGRLDLARAFYCDVLGMAVAMDLGWVVTFAGDTQAAPQVTIVNGGGSGAVVPAISIEVDDLDDVFERAVTGGFTVEYGPVREPWGVRRFFVRDPYGTLVNVLVHVDSDKQ